MRQTTLFVSLVLCFTSAAFAQESLPVVSDVEIQPLLTQIKRLEETMKYVGEPLDKKARQLLQQARDASDDKEIRELVQKAKDMLRTMEAAKKKAEEQAELEKEEPSDPENDDQ